MGNTERREQLKAKWRALARAGMQTMAQPNEAPVGRFQHFRDEADKRRHLEQVKAAQADGAPF